MYAHQFIQPFLLHFLRNIIFVMLGSIRAFFVGKSKRAHAFEPHCFCKLHQRLKVFFRLTRMPHHQSRSEADPRYFLPDGANQVVLLLSRYVSPHFREHIVRTMLQRDIEVLAHILFFAHYAQEVHRKIGGVGVMQTNPFHAFDLAHAFYQFRQQMHPFSAINLQVGTVSG